MTTYHKKTKRQRLEERLAEKRELLELYKARLKRILADGVQAYGIGTRNISRYNLDVSKLQDQIDELETEIDALEDKLAGCYGGARAMVQIVNNDW